MLGGPRKQLREVFPRHFHNHSSGKRLLVVEPLVWHHISSTVISDGGRGTPSANPAGRNQSSALEHAGFDAAYRAAVRE